MSFLAGRLAGKEGAFFFQESKHAVGKLAQKINNTKKVEAPSSLSAEQLEAQADVLPEVLRHSLPSKLFTQHQSLSASSSSSSISTSKWALHSDPNNVLSASPDVLNPLRAYLSLPQVTFGPKRWELPKSENSVSASTANELRQDRHPPLNPEKLKAAAEGLQQIGKAFAVATAITFGGATLAFGMAASKLDMHNINDFKTRGRDLVEPKLENVKEKLVPIRAWAEEMSRKWHLEKHEDVKQKPLIRELSKVWGAKSSS